MKPIFSVLALPFALALAAPAFAAAAIAAPAANGARAPLPPTLAIPAFAMHYRVLRNGWHIGEATFTLERDGNAWHFHSEANATGFAGLFFHSTFRESSRFGVVNGLIRPLAYRYTDSGRKDRDETIAFDWTSGSARDTQNGKTTTLTLVPGLLDRLSAQLAISRRLAAGLPIGDPYRIVKGGEVETYRLTHKKDAEIATPAGAFETVLVVRHDPDSKRATRFWMAPKYAWLPVKMQHVAPGDATYSFVLDRLEWLGVKAAPQ